MSERPNDAYEIVVKNLKEVTDPSELRAMLGRKDKPFAVYWGTATTGRPHVAYFVPICKIADMLHAGLVVTILFADLHAYLDNMKSPWSVLCYRTSYYETVIKAMLTSVGVSLDNLRFVRGSEYELSRVYSQDVYRVATETSVRDARRAGAEVVKQVANPLVAGLLYPLLQALDEQHLGVDAQFGGLDQRKIFILAARVLPRLGYRKRAHLMNEMVPGLAGGKMSASEAASKIDLLEPPAALRAKLASAACPPGQTVAQGNGVLSFLRFVVFPMAALQAAAGIEAGGKTFGDYETLEKAFLAGEVTPEALKECIFEHLNPKMEVVRQEFENPERKRLIELAYPSDEAATAAKHATESTQASLIPNLDDDGLAAVKAALAERDKTLGVVKDPKAVLHALGDFGADVKTLEGHPVLRVLWTVSPTGLPHLGYLVPLKRLARTSNLPGVHVVVLIDDVAAFMQGECPWELRQSRGALFESVLKAAFKALGGNEKALSFVHAWKFKFESLYMLDLYRLLSLVPEKDAAAAAGITTTSSAAADDEGEGETTGSGGPVMSMLLLPCTRVLDLLHLGAHIRLAGPTSAKLFQPFARQFLPKFEASSTPPLFLSHPLAPALSGPNSASENPADLAAMTCFTPGVRDARVGTSPAALAVAKAAGLRSIPLVEPPPPEMANSSASLVMPSLKNRIKQVFCDAGNLKFNPLLDIFKMTILPELKPDEVLILPRPEKHGGPIEVSPSEYRLDADGRCRLDVLFTDATWHPGDLKAALEQALTERFAKPLSEQLPAVDVLSKLIDEAFPLTKQKKTGGGGGGAGGQKRATKKAAPSEKPEKVKKPGRFDPALLRLRVGEIVGVEPHPNSPKYNVYRVKFGKEDHLTSVIDKNTEVPLNARVVFLANLVSPNIAGVLSEVRVVCLSSTEVLQCPKKAVGTELRFETTGSKEPTAPVEAERTIIDPSRDPAWQEFLMGVYYSDGALRFGDRWQLLL